MNASATDFEKLGVFYRGRLYDVAPRKPRPDLLRYDSKDLVTHAVRGGLKEQRDIARARESVEAVDQQIADLETQFKAETETLGASSDVLIEPLERPSVRPTKQSISVRVVTLAGAPFWQDAAGRLTPAWE